jgi:hypothetical protein
MRVAQLPDELEKLLQHHNLSVRDTLPDRAHCAKKKSFIIFAQALAPALREKIRYRDVVGDNPLCTLAKLSEYDLDAAFETSIEFMKQDSYKKLLEVHRTSIQYDFPRKNDYGQFRTITMASRTLAEFRAGLASRIGTLLPLSFIVTSAFYILYCCPGLPNPNFEAAMAAEHCSLGGCDHEFTTGNYRITTTPQKEWFYIVGDENGQRQECPESDMGHGRRIVSIDERMQEPKVVRAGLNRAEVIALVMYSGPMVCTRAFCLFFY